MGGKNKMGGKQHHWLELWLVFCHFGAKNTL